MHEKLSEPCGSSCDLTSSQFLSVSLGDLIPQSKTTSCSAVMVTLCNARTYSALSRHLTFITLLVQIRQHLIRLRTADYLVKVSPISSTFLYWNLLLTHVVLHLRREKSQGGLSYPASFSHVWSQGTRVID